MGQVERNYQTLRVPVYQEWGWVLYMCSLIPAQSWGGGTMFRLPQGHRENKQQTWGSTWVPLTAWGMGCFSESLVLLVENSGFCILILLSLYTAP